MTFLTIEEINANPIYRPPSHWIEEFPENLKNEIEGLNKLENREKLAMRCVKKLYDLKSNICIFDYKHRGHWGMCSTSNPNVLFGEIRNNGITNYFTDGYGINSYKCVRVKNGIEILGMKPSKRTSDGKFKYEGVSAKDLAQKCRENKIKAPRAKIDLVKALMKI